MNRRTLLFIPAYNCELQIPRVLDQIDDSVSAVVDEVLVIENHSTDATVPVAIDALKKVRGVKRSLIQNDSNYSLGGSIKHAILYARKNKFDNIIVLHGDDQGDVRDIVGAFHDGTVDANDLVIGARFHKDSRLSGYSRFRVVGNRVLGAAFGLVVRRRIDDLIAGLNVFRTSFFDDDVFLDFPNNLTFDAHVLLDACDKRARIAYVPISWREEDQVSNAKTVKQGWTILKLVIAYAFRRRLALQGNKSGKPLGFEYAGKMLYSSDVESASR